MRRRWIDAMLVAGFVLWTAGSLSAQQRQSTPAQPLIMENEDEDQPPAAPPSQPAQPARRSARTAAPTIQHDPGLDTEDQLAPSQVNQAMPAAVPEPSAPGGKTKPAAKHAAKHTAFLSRTAAASTVACKGAFARDSSNLKLAMAFDSRNVTFTEVDAGSGGKVMASVLFPKEPKRRLEVWWSNPANRSGTYLIVINGQSDWSAPGGMRLGLTLAELEKLNHKPFKLKGFDKNNVATLSDWDGGALAALPGGCKVSVSLRADPKIPAAELGTLAADHEFSSADAAMRAAGPTVSEILVGY